MPRKNPELFPGYRISPDGQEYKLFERAEDVPDGWLRETPESFAKKGLGKPAPAPVRDPFDHDGDGKPGGSLPKRGRPKKEVPDEIDI